MHVYLRFVLNNSRQHNVHRPILIVRSSRAHLWLKMTNGQVVIRFLKEKKIVNFRIWHELVLWKGNAIRQNTTRYVQEKQKKNSLRNPLAQLPTGGVGVGGEDDQASFCSVHVQSFPGASLNRLRQWLPGHPGTAESFLPTQTRVT